MILTVTLVTLATLAATMAIVATHLVTAPCTETPRPLAGALAFGASRLGAALR